MKESRSRQQLWFNPPKTPLFIVISGPSGAGKDAVLTRMKETGFPLEYITTLTTRPQRPGERDMIDYHFIPVEQFRKMLEDGELLESANVYGNWYGVPKQPAKQALDRGQDVIVKVDIQGATNIKKILPQAVFIFLTPPSREELTLRLEQRRTETAFDLALRLKTAEAEIKQLPLFDYIVLNQRDEIDRAVSQIKAIITAEKCRITSREIRL
jgi:guanylate kinase